MTAHKGEHGSCPVLRILPGTCHVSSTFRVTTRVSYDAAIDSSPIQGFATTPVPDENRGTGVFYHNP